MRVFIVIAMFVCACGDTGSSGGGSTFPGCPTVARPSNTDCVVSDCRANTVGYLACDATTRMQICCECAASISATTDTLNAAQRGYPSCH